MIKTGYSFTFVLFLAMFIITYIYLYRGSKGKLVKLQSPPALKSVDEIIGRATEMGRPVTYSTGYLGMTMQDLAGIPVLGYMAKLAARSGAHLIGCFSTGEMQLLAEDVVKEAFIAEGHPEMKPDMRFLTPMEYAYTAATIGIMRREKIAGHVMIGMIAGENVLWGATAAELGAIQLGGSPINQVCYFVLLCDYTLIGEEMFVAGAVLSEDPALISGLASEDIAKFISLAIIIFGVILASAGMGSSILNLLKM